MKYNILSIFYARPTPHLFFIYFFVYTIIAKGCSADYPFQFCIEEFLISGGEGRVGEVFLYVCLLSSLQFFFPLFFFFPFFFFPLLFLTQVTKYEDM